MSIHFWRKVYLVSFQKILILLFKKIPSSLFQKCFLVFSERVSQTFFIIFHEPLPKEFLNLSKKVSWTCFKKFPKIFSENVLNFFQDGFLNILQILIFPFFQRKSHEQKSFLNLTFKSRQLNFIYFLLIIWKTLPRQPAFSL